MAAIGKDNRRPRRRPSNTGVMMQDVSNGVERTRAWPRKRNGTISEKTADQMEWFRQAQWATKYWTTAQIDEIQQAVKGSPLLPRDIQTMIMGNRFAALISPDGKEIWPVPSINDVSASLDVLAATDDMMLVRLNGKWTGIDKAAVGGGGSRDAPFVAPPKLANWTQRNFDPARTTASDITQGIDAGANGLRITHLMTSSGNFNNLRYLTKAPDHANFTVTTRFHRQHFDTNYGTDGLMFRDGTSGQVLTIGNINEANGFGYQRMNNDNSYAGYGAWGNRGHIERDYWLRYSWDGSTGTLYFSGDGWIFLPVRSWANKSFGYLPHDFTEIGWGFSNNNEPAPNGNMRCIECWSWEESALP